MQFKEMTVDPTKYRILEPYEPTEHGDEFYVGHMISTLTDLGGSEAFKLADRNEWQLIDDVKGFDRFHYRQLAIDFRSEEEFPVRRRPIKPAVSFGYRLADRYEEVNAYFAADEGPILVPWAEDPRLDSKQLQLFETGVLDPAPTAEAGVHVGRSTSHTLTDRLVQLKTVTDDRDGGIYFDGIAVPLPRSPQQYYADLRKLKSIWLHHAVAGQLVVNTEFCIDRGYKNLECMRHAHAGDHTMLNEWKALLAGPLDDILSVLVSHDEHACELRKYTPFAGVLSDEERKMILDEFRRQHPIAGQIEAADDLKLYDV